MIDDMIEYPMATLRNLTSHFRSMRRQRGWTQSQLAEAAGTTQSWISRIESGHPRADIDAVLRSFRALGATARLRRFEDPFGSSEEPWE